MADDGGGLAAGGLKDTGEVIVQDRLGVLVSGARQGQGVGRELGGTCHDLCLFSFLLLVKTYKVIN